MINAITAGCVNDGVTDNTAAYAAIDAAMRTRGEKVVFPAGDYLGSFLHMTKPWALEGETREGTRFLTPAAAGDFFKLDHPDITIKDCSLDVASGVTRTAGSAHVNINSGAGTNAAQFENVHLANCARGITGNAGFFYIDRCLIEVLGGGIGEGVVTTSHSGIFMDETFIYGIGLPWITGQGRVGLDLSDCGNAVITNTQILSPGIGVKMSPSAIPGQPAPLCTSLFFTNVLADHCTTGWEILPGSGLSANNIKMTDCWGNSSVGRGFDLSGRNGGSVFNITMIDPSCQGNGNAAGGIRTAINGINAEFVQKLTIMGGELFDHPAAADVSLYMCSGASVQGAQIGNGSFKSNVGLSLSSSDHCDITDNVFDPTRSGTQLQIAGTNVANNTTPNVFR